LDSEAGVLVALGVEAGSVVETGVLVAVVETGVLIVGVGAGELVAVVGTGVLVAVALGVGVGDVSEPSFCSDGGGPSCSRASCSFWQSQIQK
jgi:hypothetical protein